MSDEPLHPIALMSDFGAEDWYVAAMKGEIVRRLPEARIIDITHQIAPMQVAAAAFQLACVIDSMPEWTVFCCVVDPGVGTARRAICGRAGRYFFSGPDNGLVTPLIERAAGDTQLFSIVSGYWRNERVSTTFHGRDLFAPAAAALARGWNPADAGPAADNPVLLYGMTPEERGNVLVARVMHVDHFGNLVTNLKQADYGERLANSGYAIRAGKLNVKNLEGTFGSVGVNEAVAYWGSAGTLEIGINQGSAAQRSGLPVGGSVEIIWGEKPGGTTA